VISPGEIWIGGIAVNPLTRDAARRHFFPSFREVAKRDANAVGAQWRARREPVVLSADFTGKSTFDLRHGA
jgi:hypothetical protein